MYANSSNNGQTPFRKKNRCLHINGSELAKRFFLKILACKLTTTEPHTVHNDDFTNTPVAEESQTVFLCVGLQMDRKKATRLFELFVLLLHESHLTSSKGQ